MQNNNEVSVKIVSELGFMYGEAVDLKEVKGVVERALSEYQMTKKETLPATLGNMSDRILMYLASRSIEGLSKNSLDHYSRVLGRLQNHIKKDVEDVTTMDVRMYIHKYSQTGVMNATVANHTDIIRRFFGWLVTEEYIDRNPLSKISTIKSESRLRKPLSKEELVTLRAGAITLRQKALFEFLYSTGCRISEAVGMKKDDVNLQSLKATVIGKGNKERNVFINVETKIALQKYFMSRLDDSDAVFVTLRKPIKRLERDAVYNEVKKIQKQSSLKINIYPHLLRHTFATHKLETGMSIEVLRQILGHSDLSTTQIYAKTSSTEIEYEYRKYS